MKEFFCLQIMTAKHLPFCCTADREKKEDLIAIRCRECDDVMEKKTENGRREKDCVL